MTLLPLIRRLVDERPTYGYQWITALVNPELARAANPPANHKRVFRIMRQNGVLLSKHTGRRTSHVHDGKVVVMRSNGVVTLTDIGRIETNSAA
jgi:putative transposase